MTFYGIGTAENQGQRNAQAPPASGGGPGEAAPLVSSPISQKGVLEVFPVSVKIKRKHSGPIPTPPTRRGQELQGFSEKSRGRLRFTATNARELLRSQFGLTYHDQWPTDGREFKRQLNLFLTRCRQAFPFLSYLWIGEFQSRGAPHVHLFLDIPPTSENRSILAGIWCSIVDPSGQDSKLRAVHHHPANFIGWKMGTGSYLCKYLDKAAQKSIPEGFHSFGRWWGNSRGLVPPPEQITAIDLRSEFPAVDQSTGEEFDLDAWKFLVRTVGRYHEKQNRRSWFRRTNRSTSALTAAPIFRQALEYLRRSRGAPLDSVPF
jgi:hypothetical protein